MPLKLKGINSSSQFSHIHTWHMYIYTCICIIHTHAHPHTNTCFSLEIIFFFTNQILISFHCLLTVQISSWWRATCVTLWLHSISRGAHTAALRLTLAGPLCIIWSAFLLLLVCPRAPHHTRHWALTSKRTHTFFILAKIVSCTHSCNRCLLPMGASSSTARGCCTRDGSVICIGCYLISSAQTIQKATIEKCMSIFK